MHILGRYDVAVIGGGHAGIEAAVASAKLGVSTVLFTLSLDAIGNLPCNPSIGGTAKGHLVREVDALGGCMGIAADATMLQSRMLNLGKGPAVHSLRNQTDRAAYHLYTKKLLEETPNLVIKQAEVVGIEIEKIGRQEKRVVAVTTKLQGKYEVKAVIMATGTYLGGKIFVGDSSYDSGPDGVAAATALTENLRELGLEMLRFKTGTPARVHRRSIDFSQLEVQPGDQEIVPFSFTTQIPLENKMDCYIAYTNEETHQVIRANMHRSALYGGKITGVGPRYCPSIEDKIVRFADKDRHQVFVEPCGENTEEMYLQGLSTSFPEDVQNLFYQTIKGFEKIEIMRPAYAIEYDCINPLTLKPSLESMEIQGFYGAGQFNGSSGYEEAAAQGLVAGINASRQVQGKEPILFSRQQSYIGTLIDDLVTKGVSDPYRMMTSRSEYRLYLRQDNADSRLTPLGREIGLIKEQRWAEYLEKENLILEGIKALKECRVSPEKANGIMRNKGSHELKSGASLYEILKRPEISIYDIIELLPNHHVYNTVVLSRIEVEVKYEGYIKRQLEQIEMVKKQENIVIPKEMNYAGLTGLRLEAREKLEKVRPLSIGQASRIPGVSPSDISQLSLAIALYNKAK